MNHPDLDVILAIEPPNPTRASIPAATTTVLITLRDPSSSAAATEIPRLAESKVVMSNNRFASTTPNESINKRRVPATNKGILDIDQYFKESKAPTMNEARKGRLIQKAVGMEKSPAHSTYELDATALKLNRVPAESPICARNVGSQGR